MSDQTQALQQQVREAQQSRTPLRIMGGDSRGFLPQSRAKQPLNLSQHHGVLQYQPEELVITLRAGTPLGEVTTLLQSHQQQLAFDPPRFSANSTIGGAVATAMAGPGRPWQGGVRDHLLGAKVLSGSGELLSFGGEVVKNVAGYDLFRPMAGAYGTLGVMLELSIKTLPQSAMEYHAVLESMEEEALHTMQQIRQQNLPLSGLCWHQNEIHLRLSGTAVELEQYIPKLQQQGFTPQQGSPFWQQLRDQQLELFNSTDPIWRISLPPTAPALSQLRCSDELEQILNWGGAERWIRGIVPESRLRSEVEALGGHATLLRNATPEMERFHPRPPLIQRIEQQLRTTMDPAGILNPGIFSTGP